MKKLFPAILMIGLILHLTASTTRGQSLKINEVQYSNHLSVYDSDGKTPDWIELINSGNSAINLKGFQLDDDSVNTDHWKLPEYILQPDSFLVVFASGKNIHSGPELHTDFKLSLMKEPVMLFDPGGKILDKVDIQCVPPDKALGRWPDKSDNLNILSPTPGFTNNNSTVVDINFIRDSIGVSHQGGAYSGPLHITLTNRHPANKIYYTLDGQIPDENAELFEGPLILEDINHKKNRFAKLADSEYKTGDLISKGNILRAVVLSEGCPASQEIVNTYFVNGTGSLQYQVPVISLITEKDNLFSDEIGIYVAGNHINFSKHGKAWERPVHIEMIDTAGHLILSQHAGLRIHGAGSRFGDQKSLRLYARDEYGKDLFEYTLFEQKPSLSSFRTLLMRSSKGWSRTLFKDEMCHTLVKDMAIDYTAARTSVLFLNGEYWGIYSLRERQDRYYVENNYGISNPEIDIVGFTPDFIEVEEGSIDNYHKLLEDLENHDPTEENYYDSLRSWFDLNNLMDFFIAQFYLANTDFPQKNFKIWRPHEDNAQWRFFFFDLDGTMTRTYSNPLAVYNNDFNDLHQYTDHSVNILRKLMENPEFRQRFESRFIVHLQTTFSPDRVLALIDQYEDLYYPIASEHIYRWNIPVDLVKWVHNVDMLRGFAIQRPLVLFEQLEENFHNSLSVFPNPSSGNFNVDLSSYSGNLEIKIYTVDGKLAYSQTMYGTKKVSIRSKLEAGVYILQVLMGQRLYTEKLLIT